MNWIDEKVSDKYYTKNSYTGETTEMTRERLLGKRIKRLAKKSIKLYNTEKERSKNSLQNN